MLSLFAKKTADCLVSYGVISELDYDIYNFGLEMGMSILFNILTTVIIGFAFQMPIESIVFLLTFIPLRSYIGGFHASSYTRCYWLSTMVVVVLLMAVRSVSKIYNMPIILGISALCVIVMFLIVPMQDPIRPMEKVEVLVYRNRARIILVIEFGAFVTVSVAGLEKVSVVLFCTFCLLIITVIVEAIKNQIKKNIKAQ